MLIKLDYIVKRTLDKLGLLLKIMPFSHVIWPLNKFDFCVCRPGHMQGL